MRRWAFTLNGENFNIEEIKESLNKHCSRWVFQLETGAENEREHLQGRMSCKVGKRLPELQKIIKGGHFSIEHETEAGDFYCTKEEGRVDGPWSDKDKKHPLPWDLEKITEWKPWQLAVFESLNTLDDRIINILVDKVGGIGKSKVFKFALWKDWAGVIPAFGDAKDIVQACCSMGPKKAYILDLPRCGESDKHMNSLWKAIEMIKNGVVLDFRYSFKKVIMGSPVVWVFTNHMPSKKRLSADRWKIWTAESGDLRPL